MGVFLQGRGSYQMKMMAGTELLPEKLSTYRYSKWEAKQRSEERKLLHLPHSKCHLKGILYLRPFGYGEGRRVTPKPESASLCKHHLLMTNFLFTKEGICYLEGVAVAAT